MEKEVVVVLFTEDLNSVILVDTKDGDRTPLMDSCKPIGDPMVKCYEVARTVALEREGVHLMYLTSAKVMPNAYIGKDTEYYVACGTVSCLYALAITERVHIVDVYDAPDTEFGTDNANWNRHIINKALRLLRSQSKRG